MTAWRKQALERIKPTPQEDQKTQQDATSLVEDVEKLLDEEGWDGTPRLEGSLAKGTYLHGQGDLDVFVAFPPTLERGTLEDRVHTLKRVLEDGHVAYAEHPYAQGTYRGHDAEIVPCYDLASPRDPRSAVDRTPFHTEHIQHALTDEQRDEVRLLKAFLETAACYGAKESVRGVSGYLAELMILHHGAFQDVLAWATRGFPHPITFEEPPARRFDAPLVIVDPVDPGRNAAAAVRASTLNRFQEAAAAFRQDPHARFFQPPAPAHMDADTALERCQARNTRVLALTLPLDEDLLEDPVHAQLRRAVTLATDQLERDQIPVHATATLLDEDPREGWILLEAHETALSEPYVHQGPPVHLDEHAAAFREQWDASPQAAGDVYDEEGRLVVKVHRETDTLADIVAPHLEEANAGKIVDEALEDGTAQVHEGDDALAKAPPAARSALLDRRRPWERTAPSP